ncbi:MAG: winged helix-turn-helix domain-containing protein [Enterocloster sp.]
MLISQFLNGTFQPGQPFPSQRVLCQRYNAGITTVRKVMKMLDEEGYVRTVKGCRPSLPTRHLRKHTQGFWYRAGMKSPMPTRAWNFLCLFFTAKAPGGAGRPN